MSKNLVDNDDELLPVLTELSFLYEDDSEKDRAVFLSVFKEMTSLLGQPFHGDSFDFADDEYFKKIYDLSERLSNMKELRNSRHPRGSRHGLYINRTYYGLYTLLNELGAEVETTKPEWLSAYAEAV